MYVFKRLNCLTAVRLYIKVIILYKFIKNMLFEIVYCVFFMFYYFKIKKLIYFKIRCINFI